MTRQQHPQGQRTLPQLINNQRPLVRVVAYLLFLYFFFLSAVCLYAAFNPRMAFGSSAPVYIVLGELGVLSVAVVFGAGSWNFYRTYRHGNGSVKWASAAIVLSLVLAIVTPLLYALFRDATLFWQAEAVFVFPQAIAVLGLTVTCGRSRG